MEKLKSTRRGKNKTERHLIKLASWFWMFSQTCSGKTSVGLFVFLFSPLKQNANVNNVQHCTCQVNDKKISKRKAYIEQSRTSPLHLAVFSYVASPSISELFTEDKKTKVQEALGNRFMAREKSVILAHWSLFTLYIVFSRIAINKNMVSPFCDCSHRSSSPKTTTR